MAKTKADIEDIKVEDSDDVNEGVEKPNKHTVRRAVEWVQDLFGLRTSPDVYDEINARYDDRSPDPEPGDGDGEPEPT